MTNPEPMLQENTDADANATVTEPSLPDKDRSTMCIDEALKTHTVQCQCGDLRWRYGKA